MDGVWSYSDPMMFLCENVASELIKVPTVVLVFVYIAPFTMQICYPVFDMKHHVWPNETIADVTLAQV